LVTVSMKDLLESGVHFGHQTRRWNPKMSPYIFSERNGIHIIDLQKTVKKLKEACEFVTAQVATGKSVLFVGTKKQAQKSVAEEAERCAMPYVCQRWLGGTLTNFKTIKVSIGKLKKLIKLEESGEINNLPKREILKLKKVRERLEKYFGGIKDITTLPGVIFVVDPKKEYIVIKEARRLGITVVGIIDSNCDPDEVDYGIPGNDDAIRAIKLVTSLIAEAVIEGKEKMMERKVLEEKLKEDQEKEAAEAEEGSAAEAAEAAIEDLAADKDGITIDVSDEKMIKGDLEKEVSTLE